MIFKLKNDNYKNFDVYKDNVMQPRTYFIPFSEIEEAHKNDFKTERYNSSRVNVLSGEWDFKYFKKVSQLPDEIDTDTFDFDKVCVPSVWQHTGYEEPYYLNTRYQFNPNPPQIPEDCPVGIYHTVFNIDDAKANYTVTFLGAAGALDVFVNGSHVGYSEGSHNTSEFEINSFIAEGENHLIAVIHKYSNGTYLEAQDMFRSNGIFRDVYITKTLDNSIYDFKTQTKYKGGTKYDLKITPVLKLSSECELTAHIIYDGELILSKSVNVSEGNVEALEFSDINVCEWSAETPNLYQLLLTLSKDSKVIETVKRPFGFKHIKINGNVFTFNNKGIKLMGVNHHDTNAKTGYVMTVEQMENDVKIFKEFNVNCVRMSHYPPDPIFMDLCDEYGVYAVDEADIEAHGCQTQLHKPGACSHNPAWRPRYWDRVYRMYERDKNHPCVTLWSLGNESWGYSNQDYCYDELKKLTDIPIHYENVNRTRRFAYDVISQMYPPFALFDRIANGRGLPAKYYKKPYFMCEYAHAMGLGAGELERYVTRFQQADNMLGGCIWEFADHAVYHENGRYKYTYGGDHGEEMHDSNFCVDGLFFPDRTPHPGAYQMKNCYRPVRAEIIGNDIEFKNVNFFKTEKITARYEVFNFDEVVQSGEFNLSIEPGRTQKEKLACDGTTVVIRYYGDDFEIACEQHDIGVSEKFHPLLSDTAPTVNISESKLFIDFNSGRIIYNTKSGEIESYSVNSAEFINAAPFGSSRGFSVSVYRAPIDNDMYISKVWDKYALDTEKLYPASQKKPSEAYSIENNAVVIDNDYYISTIKKKRLAKINIKYTVYINGEVYVQAKCLSSKTIPFAPRFALTFEMPREFDNAEYFGRGNLANLCDFKEHAMLGVYKCKVGDMREKYIKPQEASMRSETRYACVTDKSGRGLKFCANGDSGTVTFSADHFTSQQLAKATHDEDVKDCDTTFLHFDSYILGAGSNACGPVPSKSYRKNNLKGCAVSLAVIPVLPDDTEKKEESE